MSKMIQIRNVPPELHTQLKVEAARRGMTLSDYLLRELEQIAGLPTIEEWVAEVRARPRAGPDGESSAETIRELRGPL
jgi:plasmid stability protein